MTQTIHLFATTDLHGEFDGFADSETVKDLKNKFPESIWIDNGDFFMGNALTTYYNTEFAISPLVTQANAFNYDAMIPGNHDLDYGLSFLKLQVSKLTMPYVCCNLLDLDGEYIFDPYTILEKKDQKIAVIGLMTEALPQLTEFENTKEMICAEAASSLKKVLNSLPSDVDLIIVGYHGGLEVDLKSKQSLHYENKENQAYKLVQEFPQIDGFIAGHQHFTNSGLVNKTAFLQPGSHGNVVGTITFKQQNKKWSKQPKILPIYNPHKFNHLSFDQWLKEEINPELLLTFLSEYFQVSKSQIQFKMYGKTRLDFLTAFPKPFSFFKYTFSIEEWRTIHKGELAANNKEAITFYTNDATLPQHRLQKTYLDNLFDSFHQWMKK